MESSWEYDKSYGPSSLEILYNSVYLPRAQRPVQTQLSPDTECWPRTGRRDPRASVLEWSRGPSWADGGRAGPCPSCPLDGSSRTTRVTVLGSALSQVITIFSLVEVVLRAETAALKYSAVLKHPGTEGLLGPQDREGRDHKDEQED